MTQFLATIFAFPVVIYTTLLLLCVLFWLVGAIGIFQFDTLEVSDVSIDGETVTVSGLAGLLLKFKLAEIPFTVLITVICLLSWLTSYVLFRMTPTSFQSIKLVHYGISLVNILMSLVIGFIATAIVLSSFNKVLVKTNQPITHKNILGQVAIVRNSVVNQENGEAIFEDGGAGMILQVRSFDNSQKEIKRGDRVILLRYDDVNNSYEVILEEDFL